MAFRRKLVVSASVLLMLAGLLYGVIIYSLTIGSSSLGYVIIEATDKDYSFVRGPLLSYLRLTDRIYSEKEEITWIVYAVEGYQNLDGDRETSLEIAQILLDRGMDINEVGFDGSSALHRAVISNQPEIIEWLLARGADVTVKLQFMGKSKLQGAAALEIAKVFQNSSRRLRSGEKEDWTKTIQLLEHAHATIALRSLAD